MYYPKTWFQCSLSREWDKFLYVDIFELIGKGPSALFSDCQYSALVMSNPFATQGVSDRVK